MAVLKRPRTPVNWRLPLLAVAQKSWLSQTNLPVPLTVRVRMSSQQPVILQPSRRGTEAQASPIRRLSPYADAAKARGRQVFHLNIGQPDIPTPAHMLDAYRNYADAVLAYGASEGSAAYRTALAKYYNALKPDAKVKPLQPGEILVTVGGSEALQFAIAATCDVGDEILVAEPFYPNYRGFAHTLGVQTRAITTTAEDGFQLTAAQVRAAIGPRTRALLISTPGNPTGAVLDAKNLREIGLACKEAGIFLVSDEVYRDFVYDGSGRAASILSEPDLETCAIQIDSVSKRYSACGARVGCLVTRNPEIYAVALKFAQCRLSPPVVDQLAALAALATPQEETDAHIADYKKRRDTLVAGLRAIPGVRAQTPAGAFYLIVELPVDDAEKFCIWMLSEFALENQTVMLAPADGFYVTPGLGKQQVRAAYVLEVEKLATACRILRAGLEAYPGRIG